MEELVDGIRRQCHFPEGHHLVTHRIGIELTAYGMLHPSVGHKYPPSRDGSSQTGEPGGCQMETWRHFLPSEIHHGDKRRLHEESHDTLDGKGRAKDVAYYPGIIGPVGAKLKFQYQTGSYTHGEIDAEEFLPELGSILPETLAGTVVAGLHDTHDDGQAECQRHEQPMVDSCQRKLSP